MKKSNLSRPVKIRDSVSRVIRGELYPEEAFPTNLFPDLEEVLTGCLAEALNGESTGGPATSVGTSLENDIDALARGILNFKNLLREYPRTVVMMYRTYIRKFIFYQQTRARSFTDEWEDIFQEVITRLISGKIFRIRDKFDFSYNEGIKKSTFTSYLMVSVRNIYMDIIRERQVRPLTAGELRPIDEVQDIYEQEDELMLNRLAMDEEFRKFRTLLALHYRSRWKLELCLKLKCRIPVGKNDVHRCFPACSSDDMETLARDYRGVKDKHLFDAVVTVFNRNEQRENKSDTLRKWVSIKVEEIIAHMNHTHNCVIYTGKNLLDFITLYYEQFKQETDKEEGNTMNVWGEKANRPGGTD
jgi:DNA-directed RNA polymerase specialized sigma24 family protein